MVQTDARLAFPAMGTTFECVVTSFDRVVSSIDARAILEEVSHTVRDWHDRLSIFDRRSIVSHINASPPGKSMQIDRDFAQLIATCRLATDQTLGAFDVNVGALMQHHGFRGGHAARLEGCDRSSYTFDERRCTIVRNDAMCSLDFGAVAKGFVLDIVRETLQAHGATSAVMHGGTSSIACIGEPCRVGLDRPTTIELVGQSMSLSRADARMSPSGGHIMDPRSSKPSTGVDGACVVGVNAMICEIWSTALVVDPRLSALIPSGYSAWLCNDGVWRACVYAESDERNLVYV